MGYIGRLVRKPVIERLARKCNEIERPLFQQNYIKKRLFRHFMYDDDTWDCERRVIVKAEHLTNGDNNRFVVTNLEDGIQKIYARLYCKRAEAENRFKEKMMNLGDDRTNCHDLVDNQFRVLLYNAAHILVDTLRREALADTELSEAQVGTFRHKLIKIGARITCSVRRIVLHLAGCYPSRGLFAFVLDHLKCLLPVVSSG